MKVAVQTIIWGPFLPDLERVLDEIAELGFHGVEFAQKPRAIGEGDTCVEDLLSMLSDRGLELVGLSGGTVRERTEFCGSFRPNYLYVESADEVLAEFTADSRQRPFTFALHPHNFKGVYRLAQAEEVLDQHSKLQFLPDTAHLTIAGDSPATAIRRWSSRLAAVQFKDWTSTFGRSAFHYAKGFCPLGDGIVNFDDVLNTLNDIKYTGWLVVEQDYPGTRGPLDSLQRSTQWLREHDLLDKPKVRVQQRAHARISPIKSPDVSKSFMAELTLATQAPLETVYERVLASFSHLLRAQSATLWSYNDSPRSLGLLACRPTSPTGSCATSVEQSLSAQTIAAKYVTRLNVAHGDLPITFQQAERISTDVSGEPTIVSIPILNPWNPHHVWFVVNALCMGPQNHVDDYTLAHTYAKLAAQQLGSAVESQCYYASTLTHGLMGQYNRESPASLSEFLRGFADLVPHVIDCNQVTIFLVSDYEKQLKLAVTTSELPPSDDEALDRAFDAPASWSDADSLYCPIRHTSTGELLGIVKCIQSSHSAAPGRMFSAVDATVLDAMIAVAIPYIELLRFSERRVRAQQKLHHELGNPLFALRGTIHELKDRGSIRRVVKSEFGHDYLADADLWCDLMARLLDRMQLSGNISERGLVLRRAETALVSDVIAPASRRLDERFAIRTDRRFLIERGNIGRKLPKLYVDRSLFQEVLFNLFENAIKYAFHDPRALQIHVDGKVSQGRVILDVDDYGIGVDEGLAEALFEEGVRGPNAVNRDVVGQGLGLWFVREIVNAHGGTVYFANHHLPTRVRIELPSSVLRKDE